MQKSFLNFQIEDDNERSIWARRIKNVRKYVINLSIYYYD